MSSDENSIASSENSEDVSSPPTFTRFKSLPAEVRDQIWDIAAHQHIKDMSPQAHVCEVLNPSGARFENGGHVVTKFQGAASATEGNSHAEPILDLKLFAKVFQGDMVSLDTGDKALVIPNFEVEGKERKSAPASFNAVRPSQDLLIIRFQDLAASDYRSLTRLLYDGLWKGVPPTNIAFEICPYFEKDEQIKMQSVWLGNYMFLEVVNLFEHQALRPGARRPVLWLLLTGLATQPDDMKKFTNLLAGRKPTFVGQGRRYIEIGPLQRWAYLKYPILGCAMDGPFSEHGISPRLLVPDSDFLSPSQHTLHLACERGGFVTGRSSAVRWWESDPVW